MARNSLEYAFIEGPSLWADVPSFTPRSVCAIPNGGLGSAICRALADRSAKARLQLDLEAALAKFEAESARPN
jgi:hypothetical protein